MKKRRCEKNSFEVRFINGSTIKVCTNIDPKDKLKSIEPFGSVSEFQARVRREYDDAGQSEDEV